MTAAALLLVEDNDLDARLLTSALLRACPEMSIERVHDGEAGLDALETMKPDMVVLDISMPGLDGVEVLERIRGNQRTTAMPVIMCSNSDSPHDVQRSYQKHANAYVQKPDTHAAYEKLASSLARFWFDEAKLPG